MILVNIFSRALKSILKRKGRSLAFLTLVILLSSFSASAYLVQNSINNTAINLRRTLAPIVYITQDDDELDELGYTLADQVEGLDTYLFTTPTTREMIYEIADLPYVRDFEYSLSGALISLELDRYHPEFLGDLGYRGGENVISISGVSRPNVLQIETGIWELVSGRLFNDEEMKHSQSYNLIPVLISSGVAKINNLTIGSKITLNIDYFELPKDANVPEGGFVGLEMEEIWHHPYNTQGYREFEFEIVGLFEIPYEPTADLDIYNIHQYAVNQFIIPVSQMEVINNIVFENDMKWKSTFNIEFSDEVIANYQSLLSSFEARWVLYDLDDFDSFKLAADSILPPFLTVSDMSFLHRHVTNSFQSVEEIASQAILYTLIAIVVVSVFAILLYTRERKHEIGIYMALGEKKKKIIMQILLETVSVSMIGITIAILLGNVFSIQISNILLRDAFLQSQDACPPDYCWEPRSDLKFRGFANREMEFGEMLEVFSISIEIKTIVAFYSVGLLVVMFSTVAPVIYILKLKPKDLLTQGKIG